MRLVPLPRVHITDESVPEPHHTGDLVGAGREHMKIDGSARVAEQPMLVPLGSRIFNTSPMRSSCRA